MTPPRLRLVRPGEALPGPTDSPSLATVPPVPTDSLRPATPVPTDSPATPVPADSPATPVPADSLVFHLRLAPPPISAVVVPASALAELDALLARDHVGLDDLACARLAELAAVVPGRVRAVTAALARAASPAAVIALRNLPAGAPGQLDALLRCFSRGVARGSPVLADSPTSPVLADSLAVLLALDFRSSRARGFPDLVARAQALAARGPAAEFAALDVDGRRHYRLAYHAGRCSPAALAAQLRAAHLDLVWLHARLLRLRGSRLWLGGWRFDSDDRLGPAAQGHLLQAWLRWAERGPSA
ncbi:MAG: hypothetical protein IPO88_18395 [Nannocystis sp.]|uniref:hypothetical protein n=1 Tax=Nannocystis sp. TaxID=1962667 RepID=UPI002425BE6E|nr:hypothetical protein [Nannocystis sp.]MBK9755437.1 hypothetical protein [Nannocystis sp.]